MALIDFIKWNGEIGVLAYRHPQVNVSKYAKLQVSEAQEAVVVVNGTKAQKFGPGQYDLDSPNIPILRAFYGIPFGGENPWTVQVWFVNKLTPKDVDWNVDSFPVYDRDFQAQIPLEAHGKYGITVTDAERLIMRLALGYPIDGKGATAVRTDDFTEQLKGELSAKTKSLITKVVMNNGYGVNQISAFLSDISSALEPELNSFFDEFGCRLSKFYVTSVGIDTSTEAGRSAQDAINMQTHQKIAGHTWQQDQMFNTIENVANNAQGGGIMGAVLMAGMLGGMGGGGGAVSAMMTPQYNQPSPTQYGNSNQAPSNVPQPVRTVFCSRCSRKFTSDNKFCPNCGDPYTPCPKCGADNDAGATRCVTCGSPLNTMNGKLCPNCNTFVHDGTAFCPSCGRPLSEQNCPRCGAKTNGAAFCSQCGMKINR